MKIEIGLSITGWFDVRYTYCTRYLSIFRKLYILNLHHTNCSGNIMSLCGLSLTWFNVDDLYFRKLKQELYHLSLYRTNCSGNIMSLCGLSLTVFDVYYTFSGTAKRL